MPNSKHPPFTQEQREAALDYIYANVASGRALSRVLSEDRETAEDEEGNKVRLPHPVLFWRWHMKDEDVVNNLARARLNGVEVHMEEALAIADQTQEGEEVTTGKDGTTIKRKDMLGHRRLQIETRIKRAQMIAPRKYGPKLDLTSDGEKVGGSIDDVATRTAALMARAKERKSALEDSEGES